ncbi:hypothetical protein Tco_0215991 [Tanacetum coccineum]
MVRERGGEKSKRDVRERSGRRGKEIVEGEREWGESRGGEGEGRKERQKGGEEDGQGGGERGGRRKGGRVGRSGGERKETGEKQRSGRGRGEACKGRKWLIKVSGLRRSRSERRRTTNVRLETTVPQKEETFQVIIDVIKNSTCYKAFTISAEVPEIFMHQFWYTVKKVKDTESYEFLLANKKCVVDVEVFRKILDICPRVQGVDFAKFPDDEATLTFLLSLGYKGPLHKHPSMYVYHMHQPWRTLASIINKCLFGKTASNDRLRKSIIDILWGMFYRENVDYPELIWEDFAFQIDYRQLNKGRRENMHYPRTMLTEVIKQSESYQMFIKYYTSQIPPKKSRGKEEEASGKSCYLLTKDLWTEPITEPAKRRPSCIAFRDTSSVTKKMSHDPSKKLKGVQTLTPKEQLAADTMQALKESKKTSRRQPGTGGSSERTDVSPGVPDESTVVPATSSEGTEEGDDDDETIEWVDTNEEEEKNDDDDNKSIDLEQIDDEETDDKFVHGEEHVQDDDEETDDEFVHGDKQVNDDEDEEMTNVEVEKYRNVDEEVTNAAKVDARKTKEVKDDAKKYELPPTSSSLSVSLGFADQFLKLLSDASLISTVKDTTDTEINSLLDIKIQYEVSHIQSLTILTVPVLVISKPSVLTPIPETPSVAPRTTLLHHPSVSTIPPDVSELKKIDHSAEALATLKSQVPTVVEHYLGSKIGDDL